MKVWDEISSACERDELIEGTISQRVKGGLSVTIRGGVKAFLPGSQVDLRPIRNASGMPGPSSATAIGDRLIARARHLDPPMWPPAATYLSALSMRLLTACASSTGSPARRRPLPRMERQRHALELRRRQ